MRKLLLSLILLLLLPAPALAELPERNDARPDASARVVGGTIAPEGSWQSIAAVLPGPYLCGGTLIKKRWILTVAHCMEGMRAFETLAILGSRSLYGRESEVADIAMHPGYDPETLRDDIALVRLARPSSQPVALLPEPGEEDTYAAGATAYAAGWGTTCFRLCDTSTKLLEVELETVSYEDCQEDYEDEGGLTPNKVCAAAPGRDTCQGDSGGPLEVLSPRGRLLIGLVSAGEGCADPLYPGIYTEVIPYLDWIGYNTASSFGLSRSSLAFGSRRAKRTLTVTNRDTYTTRVSAKAPRHFRASPRSCNLAPGASCTVSLSYTPPRTKRARAYKTGLVIENGSGQPVKRVAISARTKKR